jgi:ATP-dependent RNA helicase DeaD
MEELLFSALTLSKEVERAVADMGFVSATPIQAQAIPVALEGRDVLGQAQTGTGKTAAFGIPLIENINAEGRYVQALILCPTRELAMQVAEEIKRLAKYKEGLNVTAIFGGDSYERQNRDLKRGCQIVVGTPGRIMDHMDRGTLKTDRIEFVVLDEADEMLNMGFLDDMEKILSEVPDERQTMLFSATMPGPILTLTKRFLKDPEHVKIARNTVTASTVTQYYFAVKQSQKAELMTRLVDKHDLKLMLVFCNTKRQVDELVEALQMRKMNAEGLHGDMSQSQRTSVMNRFRSGSVNLLVATDVAARGIDVTGVDAVFNYDIPHDPEQYVHRIGRTGRAGRTGVSFSFISSRETGRLRDIERFAKCTVEKGTVPTLEEIKVIRQERFANTIKEEIAKAGYEDFAAMIDRIVADGFSERDIAAALARLTFGEPERQAADIEMADEPRRRDRDRQDDDRGGRRERGSNRFFGEDRDRGRGRADRGGRERDRDRPDRERYDRDRDRSSNGKMVKIFMNVGRQHNVTKGDILGAVAGETGMRGRDIGDIEVYDKFSSFEVPEGEAKNVLSVMAKRSIKGKRVEVELSED